MKSQNIDYRTASFLKRFENASTILEGNTKQDIISFKYRDDCVNQAEYDEFINRILADEYSLTINDIKSKISENAWLIADDEKNRIILVEHETGLEILYIASSIASLIGLVPIVASAWREFRKRFSRHSYHDNYANLEVRKLNANNVIIEQNIKNIEPYIFKSIVQDNNVLKTRVEKLELEIKRLNRIFPKNIKEKNITKTKRKK